MLKPCIIGLGYVGLPILLNLSKKFRTIGYDTNKKRISDLNKFEDKFNEFKKKDLSNKKIFFTHDIYKAKNANFYIVAVPTPILKNKKPDLGPIRSASKLIGKNLKKGSIIVYESTVYPGLTEEICIPILEKESGLIWKKDFRHYSFA